MLNVNTWAFSSEHTLLPSVEATPPCKQPPTPQPPLPSSSVARKRAKYIKHAAYTSPIQMHTRRYPFAARVRMRGGKRAEEFFKLTDEARSSLLECHCKVQSIYVPFRAPTSTSTHVRLVGCTCIRTHGHVPALFWSTSTSSARRVSISMVFNHFLEILTRV